MITTISQTCPACQNLISSAAHRRRREQCSREKLQMVKNGTLVHETCSKTVHYSPAFCHFHSINPNFYQE